MHFHYWQSRNPRPELRLCRLLFAATATWAHGVPEFDAGFLTIQGSRRG